MEGISAAASSFAVISIADQLVDRVKQLYQFWSAVKEAPCYIRAISSELRLLLSILAEIANHDQVRSVNTTGAATDVLRSCKPQTSTFLEGLLTCQRQVATKCPHSLTSQKHLRMGWPPATDLHGSGMPSRLFLMMTRSNPSELS